MNFTLTTAIFLTCLLMAGFGISLSEFMRLVLKKKWKSRKKFYWFIFLVALLSFPFQYRFHVIDSCYDLGGIWDKTGQYCDFGSQKTCITAEGSWNQTDKTCSNSAYAQLPSWLKIRN